MAKIFVLTNNSMLAESIERFLKHTRGIEPVRILLGNTELTKQGNMGLTKQGKLTNQWVLQTFRQIADAIEAKGSLRKAVAILDFCCDDNWNEIDLSKLNPIQASSGWAAVVAMLILAFPEIHWVFITPYKPIDGFLFGEAHMFTPCKRLWDILQIHDEGFTPLFDPTNLRNTIRQRIQETEESGQKASPYVPIRKQIAAAIDEEEPYAYFNAYTAYRFGFRSHVVTSFSMMERIFGSSTSQLDRAVSDDNTDLVFEDIYLNFPDRPHRQQGTNLPQHLSDLCERDRYFDRLDKVAYRIFITVGHKRTIEPERWQKNRAHLQGLKANNGLRYKMLFKPFSGMFDLWRKSGLYRWLGHGKYKGLAEGYEWPPHKPKVDESTGSHSAPGRLLVIAERLIQRAEQILHSTKTVEDSVYGALLALEAQELLGNRTPTTALEALAIRQQLEVIAESMFYGVEAHLNVKDRFKEIEREVRSISYWFNPRTRKAAELNAQIGILNHLVLRFREYNQFDEEQDCLNEVRRLERRLGLYSTDAWMKMRALIGFFPRWYVEYLLGAIHRFIIALIGWVAVFTILYGNFCNVEKGSFWHGFADTISSFVGLQPPHELKYLLQPGMGISLGLSMAAIVLGFVHLGIFISHLYAMIARR